MQRVQMEWAGRPLTIETGRVAKQASGSALVRYGDTMILAAVTHTDEPVDRGWLPLFVDYREKFYAAGKIPGGFFKREGRPQTKEILSARQIDRPIRSLLPSHMRNEVQVQVIVLSADGENDSDTISIIGASTALALSPVPNDGPVSAVRIGLVGDELVVNPTFEQLEESVLNLVIAGTDEAIVMVEGGANEVSEERMQQALELGHEEIRKSLKLQNELLSHFTVERFEVPEPAMPEGLKDRVESMCASRIEEALRIHDKQERGDAISAVKTEAQEALAGEFPESEKLVSGIIKDIEKRLMRASVLDRGVRTDGRSLDEVRPVSAEAGILPRVHGSSLFTRGETQVLAALTLGSSSDEQKIDALEGESWKSYMLHYNFPPFSVGEVRPIRGPGRREIGHGMLAERSIEPVIPTEDVFPYTVRIVADVLESNGSSSMATVCSGSLALMDAGVPVKAAVAGVAMGLIKEGDRYAILTDILGVEDHLGDMDFKVAGTKNGITGFQLDSKIGAIPTKLLSEALEKAKTARMHILAKMDEALATPRPELSQFAPRIVMLRVPQSKIGAIIGPGGRVIRGLQEETNTSIDIDDEGIVKVSGTDPAGVEEARQTIELMIKEPEVGEEYEGVVRSITDFGAFIEILPGRDGLCHISELEHGRVGSVEDVLKMGENVKVKVIGVEDNGKIRLSRRALLPKPKGGGSDSGGGSSSGGGSRGGGSRGGRSSDRRGGRGGRSRGRDKR
ncbi:MAG: polyribonucleotide nucleotidyltransferase [Candidatus Eisenbacteria bacterium]|nr:polyribonucleotide nucleotidyltransferase [Candidatus Eisenbacteria bacterium]